LILGVSSGFGRASALELARGGVSIFGVHLDRKGSLSEIERLKEEIQSFGTRADFFNVNAADDSRRAQVIQSMTARKIEAPYRLVAVLHSIAFGTLMPFISTSPKDRVSRAQLEMTLDVMAHSFLYWVQDLYQAGLLENGT
jgi:NAD(P)-dependent dehydrogenase (short-subunit alcohol dehydrogenase family)